MKKVISLLLVCLLCVSLLSVSAGAVPAPYFCGDVNWDDTVDSVDVTLIQRHLANISRIDEYSLPMADFDHDGEVSSIDATWIQRQLAYMTVPESVGGFAEYWFNLKSFYASYDSGKAAVGVPVTFTAEMYESESQGSSYEFYLNGELVQPRSDNNTLEYTFEKSGSYTIKVKFYNWQGFFREDYLFSYRVVDRFPYDELYLKSVRWREGEGTTMTPTLVTEAAGGTAPYTYALKIYRSEEYGDGTLYSLTEEDINNYTNHISYTHDDSWQVKTDDQGRTYLYRDFSEATEMTLDMSMLTWWNCYAIEAQAKDADGNLSAAEQIELNTDLKA